jgi:hypothetical protein
MIASSTSATESQNVHDDGVCNGMIFPHQKGEPWLFTLGSGFDPPLEGTRLNSQYHYPPLLKPPTTALQ